MVKSADIQDASVARQIHALQQAAYAVEARLIGCADFPPLRETADDLRASRDKFLIFLEREKVIGALSYERDGPDVTVSRVLVHPSHFRRGVATALLAALEANLPAGASLYASTADLNTPAIKAYEKQGYRSIASGLTREGIVLRRLHKRLAG